MTKNGWIFQKKKQKKKQQNYGTLQLIFGNIIEEKLPSGRRSIAAYKDNKKNRTCLINTNLNLNFIIDFLFMLYLFHFQLIKQLGTSATTAKHFMYTQFFFNAKPGIDRLWTFWTLGVLYSFQRKIGLTRSSDDS